jgi:hypothetical protein
MIDEHIIVVCGENTTLVDGKCIVNKNTLVTCG